MASEAEYGSRHLQELERVIQETIRAVDRSRSQIFQIAEFTRAEYDKVKEELAAVRQQVAAQIALVDQLEKEDRAARAVLMEVSDNFRIFGEAQIQAAYQRAGDVQTRLHVAREQEKELRRRRDELDRRARSLEAAVKRAEQLVSQVGVVLGYLSGDLKDLTVQVGSWQERFRLGLSLLKAQEDERRRLAREIHDGAAQTMAAALMRAEICSHYLRDDLSRAEGELGQVRELLGVSLFDLRRLIFDLRPMTLDELGLVPAVRSWLAGWQKTTGLSVRLEVRGEERRLPAAAEIALFRVLQEALHNVWKHAGVDRAWVVLDLGQERAVLVVYDRGQGFDPSSVPEGGYGLAGMKERVQFLGGKWSLKSRLGRGTQIRAEVPLPPA